MENAVAYYCGGMKLFQTGECFEPPLYDKRRHSIPEGTHKRIKPN